MTVRIMSRTRLIQLPSSAQLGAGLRAGPGLVGYKGSLGALTTLNPGGTPPSGCSWDVNTLIINSNNITLDHYLINGSVFANGSNPTVTNCKLQVPAGEIFGIVLNGTGKGTLTVNDCTIIGNATSGSPQVNGIASDSILSTQRCDVSGTGDGIHFISNGSLVSQAYIHDLAFIDEGQHCDGMQGFNHTSTGTFTIEHSYVGPIFSTIGTPCNSSLTFGPPSDNAEPLSTPTVNNNYLASGLFHLRVNYRQQNGTVTNNNIGPLSVGEFGLLVVEQPASVTTWSNNRDNSGTLIPQP